MTGAAIFSASTKTWGRQIQHLPEQILADEQAAGRHQGKGGGKALDHVQMPVQGQKGQQRDHPEKKGCGAGLVAGERVREIDHGETHLKTQQLAARLDAHKQKIDGHAEHQAQYHLAQQHQNHVKGVGGHDRTGQGQMRPYAQRKDNGDGRFDRDGDVVGGKDRQHEHDDAHPHHGEQQAEHSRRIITEGIHAGRRCKKAAR